MVLFGKDSIVPVSKGWWYLTISLRVELTCGAFNGVLRQLFKVVIVKKCLWINYIKSVISHDVAVSRCQVVNCTERVVISLRFIW